MATQNPLISFREIELEGNVSACNLTSIGWALLFWEANRVNSKDALAGKGLGWNIFVPVCRTPDIGYDVLTNTGRPYAYFTFGVACSEVEIDCLTGGHQVSGTRTRACVHVCVGVCVGVCLCVYVYICMCIDVCVFVCVCTHVYVYVCAYVCTCIVCVCVYTCVHVFVCVCVCV